MMLYIIIFDTRVSIDKLVKILKNDNFTNSKILQLALNIII